VIRTRAHQDRYIALLCHVDQVDTAESVLAEIETILPALFFLSDHSGIKPRAGCQQSPGILISIGPSGTLPA